MGNRKQPFGYRMENGEIVVHPQEAEMVKNVFHDYLVGIGFAALAEKLNKQDIQYYPGKPWNKNMLARLLEDVRYTGARAYPAIIDEETLMAVKALRGSKTMPCKVTAVQKALRRLCGHRLSKSSERQLLQLINQLIMDATLISSPAAERQDAPETAELKAKLEKLLAEQPVDEDAAKPLILRLASARYEEIDNGEYETERLRDTFSRMEPLDELDAGLLLETLSSVSAERDERIKIVLKNGQIIEEGDYI